jgi:uncharacterized protein YqgV (UPF0045/DUF77 family)
VDTITLSFKILPHVDEPRLYPVVDEVIALIQRSGVKHVVGASETTMEGDWDTLFGIVKEARELCFRLGAPRISIILMADCKPGGVTIDEKIAKYT